MRKLKKYLIISLIIINMFTISYADDETEEISAVDTEDVVMAVSDEVTTLDIQSRNAIIYERDSDVVLWGKNENKRVPMASTTKIMTSIVFAEYIEKNNINWNEEVEVCKKAAGVGGSRLGLGIGNTISLNDLLYGLMLRSGNDAAVQIATYVAGSVEEFAKLMNKKASELGLTDTSFVTPHGLDEPNHYTTAYELAVITDYALNIEKIADVVKTKVCNIIINKQTRTITNTNELLGYLDGVNGVKTGFTNGAGRCLVTSVSRSGFNIITVVLGADTKKIRTKDSIKLIEYAYKNYEHINIKEKVNTEFNKWVENNTISVNKGIGVINPILEECKYELYPVDKNLNHDVKIDINVDNQLEAPVGSGYCLGRLTLSIDDNKICQLEITNRYGCSEKNNI